MILILAMVFFMKCNWADDEAVFVNQELGIILESQGYVTSDNRAAYVSAFVMMENPVANENLCALRCGSEREEALVKLLVRRAECAEGFNRRGGSGVAGTIFKTVEAEESRDRREMVENCFRICLEFNECRAFGVTSVTGEKICVLRSRALAVGETVADSSGAEMDMACLEGGNRTETCERLLREDPFNHRMVRENRRFVEEHWKLVNQWVKEGKGESRERRVKRGTSLVGDILGFLATGYTFYDTSKLKKHVNKLSAEYNKFKERQIKFNRDQVEFNKNVLTVLKGLDISVERRIGEVECRIDSLAFHILNERRLREWKDFLYHLYRDMVSGSWVGPVSTVIFTKENMRRIVEGTEILRGTVYESELALAFQLGTMHVAERSIHGDKFCVHVVIRLPIILKSELSVMFRVRQTGIKSENACVRFELPDTVYKRDGRFYVMDPMACRELDNLRLCTSSVNSTKEEAPCIQDKTRCEIVGEKCGTKIVQSSGGLLVRTEENVQSSAWARPEIFKLEEMGENSVRFFNYSEFGDVIVGSLKIRGISSITEMKTFELSNSEEWLKSVRKFTFELKRQNLTKISEIVREQQNLLDEWNTTGVEIASWTWWGVLLFLSLLIIGGGYGVASKWGTVIRWITCTKVDSRNEREIRNDVDNTSPGEEGNREGRLDYESVTLQSHEGGNSVREGQGETVDYENVTIQSSGRAFSIEEEKREKANYVVMVRNSKGKGNARTADGMEEIELSTFSPVRGSEGVGEEQVLYEIMGCPQAKKRRVNEIYDGREGEEAEYINMGSVRTVDYDIPRQAGGARGHRIEGGRENYPKISYRIETGGQELATGSRIYEIMARGEKPVRVRE